MLFTVTINANDWQKWWQNNCEVLQAIPVVKQHQKITLIRNYKTIKSFFVEN